MALPTTSAARARMVAMEMSSADWGANLDMAEKQRDEGVAAVRNAAI